MTRTPLALVVALIATPAWATFEITTDFSGEQKFFIDTANHDVDEFTGHVAGSLWNVLTLGFVDTGSGFATIKPAKGQLLNEVVFTPTSLDWGAVSFRGQLVVPHDIEVDVWDQHNVEQTFDFSGLANADFGRLGIWSPDGDTISRVEFIAPFKEFKQAEFGPASAAVPEASTWAMLLAGFGLLGYAAYRRIPHAHAR